MEPNPQLSLATRMDDWTSLAQHPTNCSFLTSDRARIAVALGSLETLDPSQFSATRILEEEAEVILIWSHSAKVTDPETELDSQPRHPVPR